MTLRELIDQITHKQRNAELLDYEIQINNASAVFARNIVEHIHGAQVGMEFLGSKINNKDKKIVIELEMSK